MRRGAEHDRVLAQRPGSDPTPAAAFEQRESALLLRQLVADLPDNQQEVVRLKFEQGLSYREISEVTGKSVSNVGYLLHHGIAQLRQAMAAKTAAPAAASGRAQ